MRSSTTSKVTRAMAGFILSWCASSGQGVLVRHHGEEIGVTSTDCDVDLSQCTIPKTTLGQIGYQSSPPQKVFSVRYTSVDTLVKLANELHEAYTALTAFDNECKSIEAKSAVVRSDFRVWKHKREQLTREEDRVTERLASALEKSTPERAEQALKKVSPEVAYVFDGF